MNKTHLSLNVRDLDRAIDFYQRFFGVPVSKVRKGYANFDLIDPPLKLALNESTNPGLSHLGWQLTGTAEVDAAGGRLAAQGLAGLEERDTDCCHARQDKFWFDDPDGHAWEVYTVKHDDAPACPCSSADEAAA